MSLPKGRINTAKVTLSGGEVEIRGLTLEQSREAGAAGDSTERVVVAISHATDTPREEVAEWLETAPAGDATKLLNAITDLSGLSAEAQFPK